MVRVFVFIFSAIIAFDKYHMLEDKTISQKRGIIYVLGFLFTLSYAIPTYINSSFLASFLPDNLIGVVYTASSLVALALFIKMPIILRKVGNLRISLILLALGFVSLVGLVSGLGVLFILASFILNFVVVALVNFCMDIFLESFSLDSKTGGIRGTYLASNALAWLLAPLIASFVLQKDMFVNVYITSLILLIPVVWLIITQLRDFKDPVYNQITFWISVGNLMENKNIKGILFAQILLQFFYAWMVIYTPLYLHEHVGFEWSTIGFILSFMLVPFVLFGAWFGRLADIHGEKVILSTGFIIMGVSTIIMGIITNGNPFVWAGVLFLTRIGAAMTETMIGTYFFKHVDASKSHLIIFTHMTRPFAYVLGPVVATILFLVFDMKGLFIFLGFLMFYGLRYSLSIRDTV